MCRARRRLPVNAAAAPEVPCWLIDDSSTRTTIVPITSSAANTVPKFAKPERLIPRSTPSSTRPGSQPFVPVENRSVSLMPKTSAAPKIAPRNWPTQSESSSRLEIPLENQSARLNIGFATAPMTPMAIAIERPKPMATPSVPMSSPPTIISPGPPSMTIVVPTNSAATRRLVLIRSWRPSVV